MPTDSKQGSGAAPAASSVSTRKPARGAGPAIMVAGLALAVAAVLFVPMLTGGATSAQASSQAPVSSTIRHVNSYQDLEDAVEELGFTPALPTVDESARVNAINVLDGTTLEVVYSLGGKTLVYRTAPGADDLSGVGDAFSFSSFEDVNGVSRSYAGSSESKLHLAVWASEGSSYSLYAESGLDAAVMRAVAESLA